MNTIRIIGGRWRRRLIKFPTSESLRPTPDRVRETLFNWLGQDLTNKRCLDLFAGSGALGIEAASRGASYVVMVERTSKTVRTLAANLQQLQAKGVEIYQQDALEFIPTATTSFDIVFIDPPYHQGWIEKLMPLLPTLLNPESLVYVEAEKPLNSYPNWQVLKRGQAGQVYFHLIQQESTPCETIA